MSVWNGHYACMCYHLLFVFNQFGDLERCALRLGNVHSADGWDDVLTRGADNRPHLAFVLQEGRKNANIHVSSGAMRESRLRRFPTRT